MRIKRHTLIVLLLGLSIMGCRWLVNFYAFHPDRHDVPAADRLPTGVEEVLISTADGETLQSYWIARPDASRVLIYFHGNAGNISHRIPDLINLADMGINVLGVGYRGYGKSTGKPSEKGIYIDGRASLDYVARTHGFSLNRVILLGRSIGSTVAVDIARHEKVAGLILVSPMTTGKAMGRHHGFGLLNVFAGDAFDNLSKVGSVRSPILIVHGTRDKIVPFEMGEQLHAQAPSPKELVAVNGAAHNDISNPGTGNADGYWDSIRRWVQSLSDGG